MLKFDPRPHFSAACVAVVPSLSGPQRQEFRAEFQALPIDDFHEFDLGTEEGARLFLEAVLKDVSDVVDAEDNPIAFDNALRRQLINSVPVRQALILGYLEGLRGN